MIKDYLNMWNNIALQDAGVIPTINKTPYTQTRTRDPWLSNNTNNYGMGNYAQMMFDPNNPITAEMLKGLSLQNDSLEWMNQYRNSTLGKMSPYIQTFGNIMGGLGSLAGIYGMGKQLDLADQQMSYYNDMADAVSKAKADLDARILENDTKYMA